MTPAAITIMEGRRPRRPGIRPARPRALQEPQSPQRGFTLVEVLVALTLFSLVLGILYGGLYSGGRAWMTAEERIDTGEERRLVQDLLRRLIEQAVPVAVVDGRANHPTFQGADDSITFVARLPAHSRGSGLYWLRLGAVRGLDGTETLQLEYVPLHADFRRAIDDGAEAVESLALLAGIERFEFDYFGSPDAESTPQWVREWRDPVRLPEAVRLRVVDSTGRERDLLASVRSPWLRGQPQATLYVQASE